ncbi:hypothetical protein OOT00_15785 [Desulfobotulus sp. H1]|uniref:XRE family transcriptional regulator n=1 Tax=Desulfobotulus pelophilus TaxID=2823377 RepID=A0ABT3ND95_9BACT|nr:hypothetical protein [Desulfobotulus pelophilus]MCW7755438.1 hypothetical protein [Desulfobotulus pelophilus]
MSDINAILYEALIQNREDQVLVPQVATMAGMAARTVYEYCADPRRTPDIRAIRAAFAVTQSPTIKILLEPPGWRLVPVSDLATPQTDSLSREIEDVVIHTGNLLQHLREGLQSKETATVVKTARLIGRLETEVMEVRRLFEDTIRQGGEWEMSSL